MEAPVNPPNQKTILIVDDDPGILALVSGILSRDYNVLMAISGQDGLDKSRAHKGDIDLLLSDFQMPDLSGVDLATKITHDRPHIKVLLMSGFPEGMLVLNEGWHFLAKPFIPSQLRTLVSGLVTPNLLPSRFGA